MASPTLAQVLAQNTREGTLYEKMPDGKIRCFACGHRCPIPEGRPGVCRVRFNQGGKLYVPWGYVGALQDDPIEKKPFFHAMPGIRALSFGMLGCDFHCSYCFPPETRILTSQGPLTIHEIVSKRPQLKVFTHLGRLQNVTHFLERSYEGSLIEIKPAFLPSIRSTPEHPFLSRLRPDRFPSDKPVFRELGKLTRDHCLALPKRYSFSEEIVLSARDYLSPLALSYRIRRKIPLEILERIMELSHQGKSSRLIAAEIGKSASHIRHIRSYIRKGEWKLQDLFTKKAILVEKNGRIRFSKEHSPGIPNQIPLSKQLAELLGFYCAEGSVSHAKGRVHAASLDFSFSKKEKEKASRVQLLLREIFDVKASLVDRQTTLAVSVSKASLASLFKALCRKRGLEKRVPRVLFNAEREVVESFLKAYVAGDGYIAPDGQIRISTISEELAQGITWLVQKLGYLPQFYRYPVEQNRILLGRTVRQSPWIYLVRWYESSKTQRHVWEDENYRYVLIKKIQKIDYKGTVYNLETEQDHTYLANGVAVHNCQNWVTSQALRDPEATAPPIKISPEALVDLAIERNCEVVASTYNEPLITSEWAVEIFKEAKRRNLVTAYISNGNGTPEVLDYIRPWTDLYKIDLKSFDDRHYRELGGALENVCRTIRDVYERGFWLEIVTLLIPGFNDSDQEVQKLTEFVASVSPHIPWHVTAFHKDYKMTDPENTTTRHLLRAVEIGKKAGLRYIYPGNLPGQVGDGENTYCPNCRALVIRRFGFKVLEDRVTPAGGQCFKCRTPIPGFWKKVSSKRLSENQIQPLL